MEGGKGPDGAGSFGAQMAFPAQEPGRWTAAWIGWRARRVSDPVGRLRVLRRSLEAGGDPAGHRLGARRGLRISLFGAILLMLLAPLGAVRDKAAQRAPEPSLDLAPRSMPAAAPADVWMVEQQPGHELYSNGLRIERQFETANEPRRYEVYARGQEERGAVEARSAPAGIVFHSTESATAEFRADQATRLKLLGKYLLHYVQSERAYHYVIDRFGRVWRIVRESDAANHAGHSVWADDRWTYINLNNSFLGVSLEGRSADPSGEKEPITRGQLHALRLLTEMLRSRHAIPAGNCVTHAQVSVSPSNREAGYHFDWATGFPFAALGLPDNYETPMPSLWLFGFTWDPSLVNLTGEPFWKGLVLGQDRLRQSAAARGMTVEQYRLARGRVYRQILAELKAKAEAQRALSEGRSE